MVGGGRRELVLGMLRMLKRNNLYDNAQTYTI